MIFIIQIYRNQHTYFQMGFLTFGLQFRDAA